MRSASSVRSSGSERLLWSAATVAEGSKVLIRCYARSRPAIFGELERAIELTRQALATEPRSGRCLYLRICCSAAVPVGITAGLFDSCRRRDWR